MAFDRVLIGIQARTASTRLPGKIYQKIGEISVVEHVWLACEEARRQVRAEGMEARVAIVGPEKDRILRQYCQDRHWPFYGGPENDLYERYISAVKEAGCDAVVRVTSDCWCIAPDIIAATIRFLKGADYVSNCIERTFPEGQDCQGVTLRALEWISAYEILIRDREHLFLIVDQNLMARRVLRNHGFHIASYVDGKSPLQQHHSIDTREDLEKARRDYEEARREMEGEVASCSCSGADRHQLQASRIIH